MGSRERISRMCSLCGQPESPIHRYWQCPKLAESEDPLIKSTQSMVGLVLDNANLECWWGRALLPAQFVPRPKPPGQSETLIQSTHGFAASVASAANVYPDGSGGAGTGPRVHAWAGSGVAAFSLSDEDSRLIKGVAVPDDDYAW